MNVKKTPCEKMLKSYTFNLAGMQTRGMKLAMKASEMAEQTTPTYTNIFTAFLEKERFITTIKDYLKKVDTTFGKGPKIRVVMELYEYICKPDTQLIVNRYPVFKGVTQCKFVELRPQIVEFATNNNDDELLLTLLEYETTIMDL